MYQLSLKNIHDSCSNWIKQDIIKKVQDINDAIIQSLQRRCNTQITKDNICSFYHGYTCRSDEDDHVVYNAHLVTTPEVTTAKLVQCLNQWFNNSNNIKFQVNGIELDLDKECSGEVDIVSECSPALSLNNIAKTESLVKNDKEHMIGVSEFKCPASPRHDLEIGLIVFGLAVFAALVIVSVVLIFIKKR